MFCSFDEAERSDDSANEFADDDDDDVDSEEMADDSEPDNDDDDGSEDHSFVETEQLADERNKPAAFHTGC